MFNIFVVKTTSGEMQVPRYRNHVLPETVCHDFELHELFRGDDIELHTVTDENVSDLIWKEEIDVFLLKDYTKIFHGCKDIRRGWI